ncbi:MAG: hypothetical protein CVT63_06135 [Candidatus Anoxymicrobium japonicum]|uniref:DUF3784 domain-containing protein n=1 Tax=Candidatus Anoxymicrobium japonicum TaxID=2013648 RepID=A0A2N3G500_9ACTN|nr:MAG: hypothetical protein CVT63_06135 [Candidatus Anoxymicrobium japonicum]
MNVFPDKVFYSFPLISFYMQLAPIALLIFGVALLAAGYFVRVKKRVAFIVGTSSPDIVDVDGLSGWTGNNLFVIGAVTLSAGIFMIAFPAASLPITAVWVVVVAIFIFRMLLKMKRYIKR